jgi:DNA-binding beta-propeller fold protein YncE
MRTCALKRTSPGDGRHGGGNAIEAYARASDGSLTPTGTYPTGGNGGALGYGHSIAVSGDGSVVVNVNAGSNSVSAFAARGG